MAAVESSVPVDTDRLSSFLDIDSPDLQSILESAAEGVVFLLQQVQVKAKEFDDLNNAKQLLEVNLGEFCPLGGIECADFVEQQVHTSNVKVSSMKEQLQKSITETHELRIKLNTLGTRSFYSCLTVESEKSSGVSEVSTMKSTVATLEETISRQKMRIETLETSHKDSLALLEKKNSDITRNEEEYKQVQTKYIEARREISNTENALQEAQGQVSTLTYKEQSLQQEVEFLRKDNDRVVSELNTKASDFSTYRKEKVSPLLLAAFRANYSLRKSRNYNLSSRKYPPPPTPMPNRIES